MATSEKQSGTLDVSSDLLLWLAGELTAEWQELGMKLGISDDKLNDIKASKEKSEKHQMLMSWKQSKGQEATHNSLAEALKAVLRTDLSEQLLDEEDRAGKRSVENDQAASFLERPQVTKETPVNQSEAEVGHIWADMDAKSVFIRELKQKYENLYGAVQPILYIRERLFCVDKVFVEGGIEYLIVNHNNTTWGMLHSYRDIFSDAKIKSARRIVEGEPGFGKSTVTLQAAYDWCNGTPNSVNGKYKILILLRLKQLGGVKSIFKAIKQFILPKDSSLNEKDIQRILKESNSVLVILDGFDEYPDRDDDVTSDVMSIIRMEMFQAFVVVLTTRTACRPKDPAPQTQCIRLTGFDKRAQDEYIRKAVVGDDEEAAFKIMRLLQENPVLADLCQVPLFFVMYAHMSHESKQLEKFKSVTSVLRFMIFSFHDHMKNKMTDENVQTYRVIEENHGELDKIAFEGLSKRNQQLTWGKEEMCKRLGQYFYDHYVRLGILVEEDVLDIASTSFSLVERTEVRFYHKIFCEWYAAHFVSTYAGKGNVRLMGTNHLVNFYHKFLGRKDVSNVLQEIDPFDHQYVFRFACGLNPNSSGKIIEYLKNKQNAHNFAVLCILEREGRIETILDSVRDLCSDTVKITKGDTLLLQQSTIQLLDVAATNDISISHVYLFNCYSTVYLSGGYHLQLKSNLYIPVLTTLNKLWIDESGREITVEEFTDILQYSSKCLALNELGFLYCLLPQSVQAESVSILRSRNVKVFWSRRDNDVCCLNLLSGLWERERDGRVMTDRDYQSEEWTESQEESKLLPKSGGTVKIKGTNVELYIPPNAFKEDLEHYFIQLKILSNEIYDEPARHFEDHSTTMVEILTNNLTLQRSATLRLPHCLQLEDTSHYNVEVFQSHEKQDEKPRWEDVTKTVMANLTHSLCEIQLNSFSLTKYVIRGNVTAKRILLYALRESCSAEANKVTIDVGYFPDLPGKDKIYKEKLQQKVFGDKQSFLILKKPKLDLTISLLGIEPEEWKLNKFTTSPKIIPYLDIKKSNPQSFPFRLQRHEATSEFPQCFFEIFQDKKVAVSLLSVNVEPKTPKQLQEHQELVGDDVLLILKRRLIDEWKDVGRYLQIDADKIKMFDSSSSNTEENIYQMFLHWKQNNGRNATHAKLDNALRKAKRTDIADEVEALRK